MSSPVRNGSRRLQHPTFGSLSDRDILVGTERRKGWLRSASVMAVLFFSANMMLILAMAHKEILGNPEYKDLRRRMPISGTIVKHGNSYVTSIPRRLPPEFRVASHAECPAAQNKLTNYATASIRSKIPYFNQKNFVMGGYKEIDKGSGDFNLVAPITMKLSKTQHLQGIYGTVAELGVHHGRFTGALFITARESEKLIAADLFEDLQYQNVDLSGFGNRQAFQRGLNLYGLNETDLHLVHAGSTEDLPFDWHKQGNFDPFRLISVDAGHTAGLTFNDLEVAFCNSLKGAIVILDDFFHNLWPGVTEGFFQFSGMGPVAEVYPFLRCEGKNFVTNDKAMHQHYYKILQSEPKFKLFLKAFAHQVRGLKVKYMMNGVEYLKCDSTKLTRDTMHLLWNALVY